MGSVSNKSKTETTAFAKLDKALRSPRWQKHSSALIYQSTKATADLAENKHGPKQMWHQKLMSYIQNELRF